MAVTVLTPGELTDGVFRYRNKIISRVSLTGAVPLYPRGVVLGPVTPNASQFVLWCYAECSTCASSPHPQCHPSKFRLDPDLTHYHGFSPDQNGTLIGKVTHCIELRPRMPKGQDQTRRCASESLM